MESMESERLRLLKYTKEYDSKYVKDNLDSAPCNMWAYLKELEARISKLEKGR